MNSSEDPFIISAEAITIINWIVYTVVLELINTFGIITNIINIICFVKLGFDDSVNISLLGLSVSDLGISVMMIVMCIGLTPTVVSADLPFEPVDILYMTAMMIHFGFTRVSAGITALIALERCLCITAPLKIKSIITQQRSTVAIICIFITLIFSGAPLYFVARLDNVFSSLRNKTLIGIVSSPDRMPVEKISLIINNFCIQLCAFAIIVVCTSILSVKLRNQSKWRRDTVNSSQVDTVSSRNQKSAKMVIMISVVFIISFIPVCTILFTMACVPELAVNGKYFNMTVLMCGLGHILENINSSMNACIYHQMSSRYRAVFQKLFSKFRMFSSAMHVEVEA